MVRRMPAKPPGAKSRITRMPTPDTRKGTIGSSGQIAGTPTTHSAPSTGPTNAPSPPITTMATTFTDSSGANVTAGRVAREQRHEQAAGERGHAARHREREQLHADGRDGHARGRRRVVAHRDHRTTDAGAAQLRDQRHAREQEREAQVVVGAARREVDDAGVGLGQRGQQAAGVEERALRDQPHRHEHRERQRGHREVETGDAQRGQADEHRDRRADEHADRRRPRPTAGGAARGCRRRRPASR